MRSGLTPHLRRGCRWPNDCRGVGEFGTPPWMQRGRRVLPRLHYDRLVEVSHAGRVQPAASDLVEIHRRLSVLPRGPDGVVHHEVGSDVELVLEAAALLHESDRAPWAG